MLQGAGGARAGGCRMLPPLAEGLLGAFEAAYSNRTRSIDNISTYCTSPNIPRDLDGLRDLEAGVHCAGVSGLHDAT